MARLKLVRPDGAILHLGSLTDQVYSFEDEEGWQYHWSVYEAKQRAEKNSELGTFSVQEAGITTDLLLRMYPDLDEAYALTTDLMRPLLFVPLDGKHVLIDGCHRTLKATLVGVDILPCYVLSYADEEASRIATFPPGKGIGF